MRPDEPTEEERALAAVGESPPDLEGAPPPPEPPPGVSLMSAEVRLESGWTVRAWFDAASSGTQSLDIVRMEIVPTSWDAIPEGGLTRKTVESISLPELREDFLARMVLWTLIRKGGTAAQTLPPREELRAAVRMLRPTRKPQDKETQLADVSLRYLDAQDRDPRQVLKEMVYQYSRDGRKARDGRSLAYPTIRNWVAEAKREGWLIGEGQGKRGGTRKGPKLEAWLEKTAEKEE